MSPDGGSCKAVAWGPFLDALSGWLRYTFSIVFGLGATLLALPIAYSIILWLIVWPFSGFIDMTSWRTHEVRTAGDRFWSLWGQGFLFLTFYAAVGWGRCGQ